MVERLSGVELLHIRWGSHQSDFIPQDRISGAGCGSLSTIDEGICCVIILWTWIPINGQWQRQKTKRNQSDISWFYSDDFEKSREVKVLRITDYILIYSKNLRRIRSFILIRNLYLQVLTAKWQNKGRNVRQGFFFQIINSLNLRQILKW